MSLEKLIAENTTAITGLNESIQQLLARLDQASLGTVDDPPKKKPGRPKKESSAEADADDLDDLLGGGEEEEEDDKADSATMGDVLELAQKVLKEDTENITANREALKSVLAEAGIAKVVAAGKKELPILFRGFKKILSARKKK